MKRRERKLPCFSSFFANQEDGHCRMQYEVSYEKLLYQYEVLRTRLKIREHYLGTVVKEVYENIGQMLSLIRVKLSLLRQGSENGEESISSSGEMVGQTINDLRSMCRLFYPEETIISGAGLYKVIDEEVRTQFPRATCLADEKTLTTARLGGERGLIVFGILLEIVTMIAREKRAGIDSVVINHDSKKIIFAFNYHGEMKWEKNNTDLQDGLELNIFDRARLVGARIQIKTKGDDNRRIKLEVPINQRLWAK